MKIGSKNKKEESGYSKGTVYMKLACTSIKLTDLNWEFDWRTKKKREWLL